MELTQQKIKIVSMVADGMKSKEIGQKLEISHRTVEKNLELSKAILGAKNAPHLIAIAFRKKIIK